MNLLVPTDGQQIPIDQTDAFRLIADFAYDWEMWLGPQRETLYVSPSCQRITGYRPATFLADPGMLTALIHPDDRAAFTHHLEHEFSHSEALTLEFRIVTRTGEECWISHVCQPVHGADGRWLGRRASNRDITDRVRAEEAYRNLVDHSLQGLVIFQDGLLVFANQAAAEMTGFSQAELLHWRAEDMVGQIHSDDRAFVWKRFQERVAGKSLPHHYGFRFVRKDGVVRHWEIFSSMLDYWGKPAIHVALLDVSERHEAEAEKEQALAELRASETRHRRRSAELETLHDISLQLNSQMDTTTLLQLILDKAIALLDVDAGIFFLYDPARDDLCAEYATDYLTDFLGIRLRRDEGIAGEVFQSRQAMIVNDYPGWARRVSIQAQRPRLRNLMAVPLNGKDDVLGVLDLGSEQREFNDHDVWLAEMFAAQAAVALESARLLARVEGQSREMVRVEKMAALGRMAAALAHEINNPLQAIQSHVELVMDFELPPEQQAEFLGVVRSEMTRLTEIVQRVLDFSRPSLAQRRPAAVDEMVRQTLALAGKELQRNAIRVASDLEEGLIVAVGRDQIVQVFLNLVINAVEAIGQDGHIDVRAIRDGDRARITFANDGPPIPESDLLHVFEPFYTTKTDGTGLGLAVSQNLIEQYGGRIAAVNRPDGAGVIFTISLPLTAAH